MVERIIVYKDVKDTLASYLFSFLNPHDVVLSVLSVATPWVASIIAVFTKIGAGTFSRNIIVTLFIFPNSTSPTCSTLNTPTTQRVRSKTIPA